MLLVELDQGLTQTVLAQNYGPHTFFLNQIWLEPWVKRWFRTSQNTTDYIAVYDQVRH